ncbi:MAG: TetR family transcriptional regulator [bacterium]|nr:TetR family transcriptional regulator [bacterium]
MAPETAKSRPDAAWQRARRPEQKAERRRAILDATVALLDEAGVEGATLSEIARRAGLSKANCYRYFESREAILLELTLAESRAWMDAIEAGLVPLADSGDVAAVTGVFADATVARPRLCTLYGAIYSVMERNVRPDGVAEFKQRFHERVFGSGNAIVRALPDLTAGDAEQFVLFLGFFIAGAWPSATPAPGVPEALARRVPGYRPRDFETMLRAHTRIVLQGLLAEHAAPTTR